MLIAIPSSDKIKVSEHFGRAKFFALYNTQKKTYEYLDNESNLNAMQGSGIQSATALINNGIETVISPNIGPKAFEVLKSSNIKMYLLPDYNITVEAALDSFNRGTLDIMESFKKS